MSLSRFVVIAAFSGWSPEDRERPEKWVWFGPGERDLFTDDLGSGAFVKFLKNGLWYEAERGEFERATVLVRGEAARGAAS